jgi:Flp pilus assembly protein TadG
MRKRSRGSVLVEALCGFFVFIPLAFTIADVAVVTNAAQANEEFAEQLARLVATVQTLDNAKAACRDVIRQYQPASNIKSVNLDALTFDVGLKRVSLTTSMVVALPIPVPGGPSTQVVTASVSQPIVSFPADP